MSKSPVFLKTKLPLKCSWILLFSISAFHLQIANAQSTQTPPIVVSVYPRVVDLAFSYPVYFFPQGEYRLILRFLPSFEAESQIVISGWNDDTPAVTTYTLVDKTQTISSITDSQNIRGIEDPAEIAKLIKVQKKELTPSPPEVKALMSRFLALRLSPNLSRDAVLDGTRYDLEYQTFSNRLQFVLSDETSPVVQWMNQIKKVVFSEAAR